MHLEQKLKKKKIKAEEKVDKACFYDAFMIRIKHTSYRFLIYE